MNNDDIFDSSALSAREQVTEWVNIKERLGKRVSGKYLGFWIKPAEGLFREQLGIALADLKDPSVVYGVNVPSYFRENVLGYRLNDRVGVEYYKDIPAKQAGMSATKAVRLFNPDQKIREANGEAKPTPEVTIDVVKATDEDTEDQGF